MKILAVALLLALILYLASNPSDEFKILAAKIGMVLLFIFLLIVYGIWEIVLIFIFFVITGKLGL